MRRRHALLLGPALALAAAAPASAADVEVKGLDTLVWDRPDITVTAGDTVHWTFAGTAQPHNIASSGSNWSYRTEPGPPPAAPGAFTFSTPGVYGYVCEIHATTMIGKVTVTDASGTAPPPPPPAPPGEQPFPNDAPAPTELERGGLDTARPSLSGVRVRTLDNGARIRLRVSERSRLTVRFRRGGRTVKTARATLSGRRTLTVRRLPAGRYRVELRAQDLAGNRSQVRRTTLTIRT